MLRDISEQANCTITSRELQRSGKSDSFESVYIVSVTPA